MQTKVETVKRMAIPMAEGQQVTTPACLDLVEMWRIERLQPNPRHARMHSDEQVAQLANSIGIFRMMRPILVDENGVVLAGHGLLLAMGHLGWSEVPVLVIKHLTESQKEKFALADNQLALNSTWDEEKLKLTLEALEKDLDDLEVIGFPPQELDRLLADLAPECLEADEDIAPEPPVLAIAAPGDLWALGKNLVLCGDALSSDSMERVLKCQPADMVFSDPPYNVAYTQKSGRHHGGVRTIANDDLGPQFEKFLHAACVQVLSVTRGAVYLCMSSSELSTLQKAFTAAGGHWSTFLIWSKDRFTLGRSDYQRLYEPILYGWKEGQPHFWCGARDQGDVWHVAKPQSNRLHPTMKPVSLIERAIRNSSRRGDLVLDPFGGSGSTLIACEKSGRRAALVELEPKYVDVIVRRWEAYTGREAQLESDGRSFAVIAKERLPQAA
jgi:DNA modification methylase